MTFEESIKMLGEEVLDLIGRASSEKFVRGDNIPIAGKVTSRTGALEKSILGIGEYRIRESEIGSESATFTIGTKLPYAALMEKGGVRVVTDKMRKFFWHKYFTDSGALKDMWARLRFKNLIRYLPRPFLVPAAEEIVQTELPKLLNKYTMKYLRATIQEMITGIAKADVYNAPYKGLKPL